MWQIIRSAKPVFWQIGPFERFPFLRFTTDGTPLGKSRRRWGTVTANGRIETGFVQCPRFPRQLPSYVDGGGLSAQRLPAPMGR